MNIKIAFITLLSIVAFTAQADTVKGKRYVGTSVNFTSYEEPLIDTGLLAISGRLGTFVNEHISLEARLGLGLMGNEANIYGTLVDIDLNYIFGVYTRAGLPINEKVYPYVLLGYSRGEVEASAGGFTIAEAESDVSFGFGVDFKINKKLTLNAEYLSLLDKDGVEISGLNLGASISF